MKKKNANKKISKGASRKRKVVSARRIDAIAPANLLTVPGLRKPKTGHAEDRSVGPNFNNVITASRMNYAMQCWRKHFWAYEIGLRKIDEQSIALRIGSAWARAMEARWNGATFEEALAAAIPEGSRLDNYAMATISALLAAYYDIYGQLESFGKLHPEVQFRSQLGDFTAEGKIDGLGSLADGRSGIIEAKTTSDSLAPDSDYWLRLAFNLQCLQYIIEARQMGWDISVLFYDVTRKPMIQPKEINDLDNLGRRIVLNSAGERVWKTNKAGEQVKDEGGLSVPILSANKEKGWVVKSHIETPDEFCDRLYLDAKSRPDFYFCRKEVPVLDAQLEQFLRQRAAIIEMIITLRDIENAHLDEWVPDRDPEAWPRNVSEHTCDFCSFKSFCLQGISVDVKNPPEGFQIQPFNPELNEPTTKTNPAS